MTDDTMAKQALISRLIEAKADGLTVTAIFAGVSTPLRIKDPISSGGVLEFESPDGSIARVLESSIIAVFERDDE